MKCNNNSVLNADKSRRDFAKELWQVNKAVKTSADSCAEALKYFPDSVIKAWHDQGMSGKGLSSTSMLLSLWKISKDSGEENLIRFMVSGTIGVFSPESRVVIYQRNCKPSIIDYPYGWKNSIDVCGHEIAHFVQWTMGSHFPTEQVNYLYCRESHMLDEYGAQDPEEFFADACWLAMRYPGIMRKWMPETYKWCIRFFRL